MEVSNSPYLEEVGDTSFEINIDSGVKILVEVPDKFIILLEIEYRIKVIDIMDIDLEPIYNIKSNLL